MTAIYSSNMPQEQEVEEIQKILNALSSDDILDLLLKLDEAMDITKKPLKVHLGIENPERLKNMVCLN